MAFRVIIACSLLLLLYQSLIGKTAVIVDVLYVVSIFAKAQKDLVVPPCRCDPNT